MPRSSESAFCWSSYRRKWDPLNKDEFNHFKIYLPRMVHGDFPFGHNLIAETGIHDAVANQHGAVSVVLPNGKLLGVKPDEFELVQ